MTKVKTEISPNYYIENGYFYISLTKFKEHFIEENILFENMRNCTDVWKELQEIEISDTREVADMVIRGYLVTALENVYY